MRFQFTYLFLLVVILISCKKDEDTTVPYVGYNYAAIESGRYVIYDVDSIFYDDFFSTVDTFYFEIKEVIGDKYIDLEGEEAYELLRYKKTTDTTGWVLQDAWSIKLTATTLEEVEENVRYVKLVFPVKDNNKQWNGNSMNNLGGWDYEYTAVHQSETLAGLALDSVLTVLQRDETNLIEDQFYEEKYATNVGMVYKRILDVKKDFNSSTGNWEITSGLDYTMVVSSYGN